MRKRVPKRRRIGKKVKVLSLFYRNYIRSEEWREFREIALDHHGRRCGRCGHKKRLQVHHLHYENLGDESVDDVTILCFWCHEAEESRK
ncbi:MAG: hypothetical protein E6R03_04690 [Hyphomicrobiaceae bacterium]|nr:MAG: hypothetical protein E6R03_04690 [Hyphomicrobiaceae bacterium]